MGRELLRTAGCPPQPASALLSVCVLLLLSEAALFASTDSGLSVHIDTEGKEKNP